MSELVENERINMKNKHNINNIEAGNEIFILKNINNGQQ